MNGRSPSRAGLARPGVAALCAALALALAPAAAQAATVSPTRLDDPAGPGSCPTNCSLRQAIAAAGPGGTVSLLPPAPSGTYKLTLGPLALTANVTITGPGAGTTAVSGGGAVQLVTIAAGVHVTISALTLTGGLAVKSKTSGGRGGAIANSGIAMLSGVALSGNRAAGGEGEEPTKPPPAFAGSGGQGGAISNDGVLTVEGSTFSGNSAEGGSALNKKGETAEFAGGAGSGGAIVNRGLLVVVGTSFAGNVAEQGGPGTVFGSDGGRGGAIVNSGSARIGTSVFSGNSTLPGAGTFGAEGGSGGAIDSASALRVTQSTFTANTAGGNGTVGGEGGAIDASGAATIEHSTLSANTAPGPSSSGGAISSFSALTLNASTVTGNSAAEGGGIETGSSLEATNSTITGNTATKSGGGIENFGSATLANVTLTGNTAAAGGGGNINSFGAAVLLHDTIVAQGAVSGGSGGENCAGAGAFISLGFNLEDRNQCGLSGAGDLVNVANPLLGPLVANGGATATIALAAGSPAIDAGDPAGCSDASGAPLTVDQRGVSRPQGTRCDIGAYELVQPPPPPPVVVHPTVVPPVLSGLRVSPSPFRAGASGPTIAAKRKTGATISYRDTLASTTAFAILRNLAGVRSGKRCVAPPRKRSKKKLKRCTRLVGAGSFSHRDRAGANSLRFSGRVKGKKLAVGSYTLRATPVFAGHAGKTVSTTFKIRR